MISNKKINHKIIYIRRKIVETNEINRERRSNVEELYTRILLFVFIKKKGDDEIDDFTLTDTKKNTTTTQVTSMPTLLRMILTRLPFLDQDFYNLVKSNLETVMISQQARCIREV